MFAKVFHNGIAVIVTTISATVASIILARTFGPEKWGAYSQISWLISIVVTLLGGSVIYTAMRFLGAYSSDGNSTERTRLLLWLTTVQLLLIVPGCLLLLLFAPQIILLMGWHLDPQLVQAASLGVIALSSFQLGSAMLRGLQEFRSLAIVSILNGFITMGAVALVLRFPDIGVLIAATALGQLLLIPFFIYFLRSRSDPAQRVKLSGLPAAWRIMLRYSSLVYLTTLVDQVVWQRSETLFLGRLGDSAQAGYYSLAYTIAGTALTTVTMAITGTLTPLFSSSTDVAGHQSAELPHLYRQSFSLLNWIALPCAVGLAIVGPAMVLLLYGEAFTPVIPVLYLVILSTLIGVYARPGASIIHAINKPAVLLLGSLAVLPLNLGLAWYLVPRQGAIGAAIANLAAQSLGAMIVIVYATGVASLDYDWSSMGKSALGSVACGAVAWLAMSYINTRILAVLIAVLGGAIVYFLSGLILRDETTYTIKSALHMRLSTNRIRLTRQISS